jgi:hypothetical protein
MKAARCDDCGIPAPPSDGDSDFLSIRHGWRLSRQVAEHGGVTLYWRCAECWRRYKALTGQSSGEHVAVRPPKR